MKSFGRSAYNFEKLFFVKKTGAYGILTLTIKSYYIKEIKIIPYNFKGFI